MPQNNKPIPRSILIFGPAAHIGRALGQFLTRSAPGIKLRLSTSSAAKVSGLKKDFPAAEIVTADYTDEASLKAACLDMECVFIIINGLPDERVSMANIVAALKAASSAIHIIRLPGMQPESSRMTDSFPCLIRATLQR